MKTTTRAAALLTTLLLAPFAVGHPPAADPHAGCLQYWGPGPADPTVVVQQMLSYLDPVGTSLGCNPATDIAEFGSHAPACPPPPFIGPIPGAFCGPVVPPGGVEDCTWWPGLMTVPTELVIGYDPKFTGFVPPPGPVWGHYPPGSWSAPNPYPVSARIIAFPTNVQIGSGALAPGDWHNVGC